MLFLMHLYLRLRWLDDLGWKHWRRRLGRQAIAGRNTHLTVSSIMTTPNVTKDSSVTENRARRETAQVATGVTPAVLYMAAKKLHLGTVQFGRTIVRLALVGVAELKVALLHFDPYQELTIRRTNTFNILPIVWFLV
jgi:hypothetical protein